MARGSKYGHEIRAKALGFLAQGMSVKAVSAKMGLPKTTVSTWHVAAAESDDEFLKHRDAYLKKLFRTAFRGAVISTETIVKRVAQASEKETEFEQIMADVVGLDGISQTQKEQFVANVAKASLSNARDLAVLSKQLMDMMSHCDSRIGADSGEVAIESLLAAEDGAEY